MLMVTALATVVAGAALAPPAHATVISGGSIGDGSTVTGSISNPGDVIEYTFDATAGRHVTFDVTETGWASGGASGSAALVVRRPTGVAYFTLATLAQTPTYLDFTPDISGTWRVELDPGGNATGSATFRYVQDQVPQVLTSGVEVTKALPYKGQQAPFTFVATAGRHVTIDVTATGWVNGSSGGSAYLTVYRPTGASYYTYMTMSGAATYIDFVPDVDGAWRVVLDPITASTGSATFRLVQDDLPRALAVGVPVTTELPYKGQNAPYTLTVVSGQQVTCGVTATGWTNGTVNGSAYLTVFRPTGSSYYTYTTLSSAAVNLTFTPDVSGTWRLLLDPITGSVGGATFSCTSAGVPTIVELATAIKDGQAVGSWAGGALPYSWGGGHSPTPGPSTGTCVGYDPGAPQPCQADVTVGLDCSGFARWVYSLAYGSDVLGAGNSASQLARTSKVDTPRPGDLAFFGTSGPSGYTVHHVGIYIGDGKMINALRTGTNVKINNVSDLTDHIGYWRL